MELVIFFVPGCHPVFFQVFPVVISGWLYSSLFPLDADGAVMRNLVFMFGSLEKAKLQEGKATLEMAGKKEMWENI